MEERELSDDVIEITEATPKDVVRLLEKFNPNEYWEKHFQKTSNTKLMMAYVEALRKNGLDIGKGNATFGYKMPLPDKDLYYRALRIFRRR